MAGAEGALTPENKIIVHIKLNDRLECKNNLRLKGSICAAKVC